MESRGGAKEQITLGRSGVRVSRIAFGTWQLGGDWGRTDEDAAIAAIRRAADHVMTLFDTAQAYGFGASDWTLANPAVQVAIVGTRNAAHVDDALAAPGLHLDGTALARIDAIMASSEPVSGPSPETV
jgi:aryl-alcohol dehydrogenase-like predicted oxidoreductase